MSSRTQLGLIAATGMLPVAALLVAPVVAHAGNGFHVRTPVQWDEGTCMTIVDRSVDPVLRFSYGIPYEDTEVTPDEVDQSRTHQFFGFCRDRTNLITELPTWIKQAEVDEAAANGLGEASDVTTQDILDSNDAWAGCFVRITEDADRRPITFDAAAEEVVWDTTGLEVGPWHVEGYTYEPWLSIWKARPGVVKVVDDPDLSTSPPAIALDAPDVEVIDGTGVCLTGCVSAMPGSTISAYWAPLPDPDAEPQWQVFVEDATVDGGTFALEFDAPPEAVDDLSLWIRVDVEDPMGRSHIAYSDFELDFVPLSGSAEASCGDDGTGTGETGDDSGSGTTVSVPEDGGGEGCACNSTRANTSIWSVGMLLGFAWLRRRRRRRLRSRWHRLAMR